jgi:putative phosphoesterase
MRIGVLSDIHDHLDNLRRALDVFARRELSTLIFCGDFCSPIPARALAAFEGTVHCVFGNGDGDRFAIASFAHAHAPNLHLHGPHAELELGGVSLAVTHYPLYGQALARTGDYRAVFSGHTHEVHQQRFGECLWLNPGEILGWKGPATCAVFDTETCDAEILTLS